MRECETVEDKISIIVPVYNAEKYLDDTLRDLLCQNHWNMEIIIIDDGSTDGSRKIIEKYVEQDSRFIIIKSDNVGPSKARNKGLDIATGEYIRFIDADDRIRYDSMKSLLEVFKRDLEVDLVIGNYITNEKKAYFTGEEIEEGKVTAREFAGIFMNRIKSFYFGVPWNKLYKRSIIEKNKIRFNESIIWCEDFLFNVDYYSKCKKMFFLNMQGGTYQYCTRETGITANIKHRNLEEINRIDNLRYEKMRQYCEELGMLDRFELEWKYDALYENLSKITEYFRNDYIWEKYRNFKKLINEEDAYQYICNKYIDTNYKVWRLLKEALEKQKYLKVFLFFILKGFHRKYMGERFSGIIKSLQDGEVQKL